MMKFKMHLKAACDISEDCFTQQKFYLNGCPYLNGESIDAKDLAQIVRNANSLPSLIKSLDCLNGFYFWVEHTSDRISASVDHIRSRPLFYSNQGDTLYLSDDAEWVRLQVGDHKMDPIARREYQLAGYVTGAETLFSKVKQLQAGEFLVATENINGLHLEIDRYYRFLHVEPDQVGELELISRLDEVAVASIKRLIDYANGRQIVVPLSGGYDSRLIVTLLKRLNYKNIVTFTYGVRGNKESDFSKRIADSLGLSWHFVEYTKSLCYEAWNTSQRWEYQKWACGWSSVAHTQDWIAVQKLKQSNVVEVDAIFVPGHTGDFISGGHIPSVTFEKSIFSNVDVCDAVLKKHYSLAPMNLFTSSRLEWSKRILQRTEIMEVVKPWQFSSACEKWEWQERQSKYIVNSVRVYEYFGYDWWIPLWDKELIAFWSRVAIDYRRDRRLYVQYVKDSYAKVVPDLKSQSLSNANYSRVNRLLQSVRMKSAQKIILIVAVFWMRKIYTLLSILPISDKMLFDRKVDNDPLCWYSRYNYEKVFSLHKKGYTQRGINANDLLSSLDLYLEGELS